MTLPKNYKIDFVNRTREILELNFDIFQKADREVTFLLNCLLGLIVTISENEKRQPKVFTGSIDSPFLSIVPDKVGFIEKNEKDHNLVNIDMTEMCVKVGHKHDLLKKSKIWLINKIRNGIAHQNIESVQDGNRWIGIRLWNSNSNNKKDFEIEFTIEELKSFAIALSTQYLETQNLKCVSS